MGVPLANARVGAFRTTLRFGTSLRYALPLRACFMPLTHLTLDFEVLPCFYTCVCFTLFDTYFQLFTKLNLD
ncbi:MAG: hypothetical protein NZ455_14830 [Bacteroidia bacterium]|nr:hypothetical protein [Bacteroidia bacterium]MDW8345922.1 hypothetical protein [Bacteroidia bacterium]